MINEPKQRLLLAKYFGFRDIAENTTGLWGWIDYGVASNRKWYIAYAKPEEGLALCGVPDYPQDLNAMREIKLKLSQDGKLHEYWRILWRVTRPNDVFDVTAKHFDYADFNDICMATAQQESEAACRLLYPRQWIWSARKNPLYRKP